LVEASEILSGNPILKVGLPASLVNFVVAEKGLGHSKTGDVALTGSGGIPVPRNFDGVLLAENRVENRLFG
jgi:hypothetical protein